MSHGPASVRRRLFGTLLALASPLVLIPTPAAGQDVQASIIGEVADNSGGVLPGVTVTASSPALLTRQVAAVTNERGEYRLTLLPIGTYTVQYELAGFQTVRREGIRLTAGFTAKLDVVLSVGAVSETITVSGSAPIVDVTSSTNTTHLTKEAFDLIPTSRSGLQSVLVMAPGVRSNLDDGTSGTGGTNPMFRAFGQNNESWTQVEGIVVTAARMANQSGVSFDSMTFDEANVTTVGANANTPSRGILLQVVVKSGSNRFAGGGQYIATGAKLQANNVSEAFIAQNVPSAGEPIKKKYDTNAELSGPVMKDKLWFYGSVRRRISDQFQIALMPDGTQAVDKQTQNWATIKLTQQVLPSSRVIGYFSRLSSRQLTNGGTTTLNPLDSSYTRQWPIQGGKIEWQTAKGNAVFSAQYGDFRWYAERTGRELDSSGRPNIQITDTVAGKTSGMPQDISRQDEGRKGLNTTFGWYKPTAKGNHDVKAGFDYTHAYSNRAQKERGQAGNYRLQFATAATSYVFVRNTPAYAVAPVNYVGAWVQDSWTLGRRLTLNLGLRYAHDRGYLPNQCSKPVAAPFTSVFPGQCVTETEFKIWQPVTPRTFVSYDVTGNGRTVLKGGWGLYAHERGFDELALVNTLNESETQFLWRDLNRDRTFQVGEANLDTTCNVGAVGCDYVAGPTITTPGVTATLSNGVLNPDEKEPMYHDANVALEQQLSSTLAVRFMTLYSHHVNTYRLQNNKRPYESYSIPVNSPDPGPDNIIGTADDGKNITYYKYPTAISGAAFQQSMLINDQRSNATFKSFELAMTKRLQNRWMLMASYSGTKIHVPYKRAGDFTGVTAGGLGLLLADYNPNAEINSRDDSYEWTARLTGAYTFPYDVQMSMNYEMRSGDTWARTVVLQDLVPGTTTRTPGSTIPTLSVRAEPVNANRLPNLHLMNTRFQKNFRVARGYRLGVQANIFNTLNMGKIRTLTAASGPTFMRPASIYAPRSLELGVNFSF